MFKASSIAGLSLFAVMAVLEPAQGQVSGICFAPTEKPTFTVVENAAPPLRDGDPSYKYYPATAVSTMNLNSLARSRSSMHKYYFQWANHGPRSMEKGNTLPGGATTPVTDFSSPDTADACTLAQTATALGLPLSTVQSTASSKLSFTRTASTTKETMDVCVLPTMSLPQNVDLMLDYEVQDGRTDAQALSFLTRYAALAHQVRRQVVLYTNPLESPGQRKSGLDATDIARVAQAFDGVSILLWPGNAEHNITASFQKQVQMLGSMKAKGYVVFDVGTTSLADASTVRNLMTANHVGTVVLWRDGGAQGGNCATPVNRQIACLAYGRCTS